MELIVICYALLVQVVFSNFKWGCILNYRLFMPKQCRNNVFYIYLTPALRTLRYYRHHHTRLEHYQNVDYRIWQGS